MAVLQMAVTVFTKETNQCIPNLSVPDSIILISVIITPGPDGSAADGCYRVHQGDESVHPQPLCAGQYHTNLCYHPPGPDGSATDGCYRVHQGDESVHPQPLCAGQYHTTHHHTPHA